MSGGLPDLRGTLSYDYDSKGLKGFSSDVQSSGEGLKSFQVNLKGTKESSEGAAGSIAKLQAGMPAAALATGAITAALVSSTKAALDYDGALAEVATLSTDVEANLGTLHTQVLDVSSALGQDAVTATRGLYNAISAGIPQDNAISFLETAGKAAVAGVSDVNTAVSALTVGLNAYGIPAAEAERVSDALFTTVKQGVTTFGELGSNFGQVAGLASSIGVGLEPTLAALAQVTKTTNSTSIATTQVRAAMTALVSGSAPMTAALQSIGYANGQAAVEALGFQGTLEELRGQADSTGTPLTKLFGSVEAVGAVLNLTGDNALSARAVLGEFNDTAGATAAAYDIISQTPAQKLAVFRQTLNQLAITVGDAVLPILGAVLDAFTPLAQGAVKLAGIIGGALSGGFSALPGPIRVLIGALTGVLGIMASVTAAGVGLVVAFSPLLKSMGLMGPVSKLAGSALSSLTGGATAFGTAVKGALGPIGLLITAASLMAAAVGAANKALDESVASVDASRGSIESYAAAAQRARDEGDGLAKVGFRIRDGMALQEEQALRNREAITGFFSAVSSKVGEVDKAIGGFLGMAEAEQEVAVASKISTQAVIDGAAAYLAHATNIDPAILKSEDFQAAQSRLNGNLRSGAIDAETYKDSLIQIADAYSISAGGGAVLSQFQQNAAASIDAGFQATLRQTKGLSESALASEEFTARQAQLTAELARGHGNREQATQELIAFARQLSSQDEAYQNAISGNQQFDAAYRKVLASFESGATGPVAAIAEIQRLGSEYGIASEKVDEATGRILASSAGISDTLKNAGFQLDLEAVADPQKRAETIAKADQSAFDTQKGIFSEMLAARKKLETDLAAATASGGDARAKKVADTNTKIAEAEASGNAARAAELRAGLATELAELDAGNANRIAEIKSSYEEERQVRLAALAQSQIDQLNARLSTGDLAGGEEQALAIFGAIKAAVPDASFIDPATEATLRFNAAIGRAGAEGGATAENLLAVTQSLANVDASLDEAEGHAEDYGNTATAAYQSVLDAADASAGGIVQAQGTVTGASEETRGALVDDAEVQRGALEALQRGHEETTATVQTSMGLQQEAMAGARGAVQSDGRAIEGALSGIGDAGDDAGRRMASGAVVGKKAFTGVGAAVDRAGADIEAGSDRMVTAAKDAGQRLSGVSVDVALPFESADAAARGAVDGVKEFGREGVAAAEDVASAQASSSGDQASSLDETRGALDEATGAAGEYKGALEELPDDVETGIVLDASDAEKTLDYLLDQVKQLDGKSFGFKIKGDYETPAGSRAAAGSPLLVLQDLWAIQDVGNRRFTLQGAFNGSGLMGAVGGRQLGLKEQLDAIYEQAQHPLVYNVRGVVDPEFAAFLAAISGRAGAISSAVSDELQRIAERLVEARRAADDLQTRIDYLKDGFLQGGAGEPGSLAWLMQEWEADGFDPDLGGLFSDLNIPVDTVAQFTSLIQGLADAGQVDRARELWDRFYDGIIQRQEEYHAQRMAHFEEDRAEAEAQFEIDSRRIDELIERQGEDFKKSGGSGDTPKIKNMGDEIDAVEEKYRGLLSWLGHEGDDALTRFYEKMTGGARKSIETNDDLTKAMEFLGEGLQQFWDGLEDELSSDHETAMSQLASRRDQIDLLLADQAYGEEVINALLRERDELLKRAEQAVKAQADMLKNAEEEAHRLVMQQFDARQKALKEENDRILRVNKARRDVIEEERELAEDAHEARMQALDDEAAALQAAFDAEDKRIQGLNIALEKVKLGGVLSAEQAQLLREAGIDPEALAEAAKQMAQQESLLDSMQSLLSKIPDSDKPTRVKVTEIASDAERAALQKARDEGLINPEDQRIIDVALAGWGVSAERLREILSGVSSEIENASDSADPDALSPLDAAQRTIDLAENAQKSARLLLDDQLAAIDVRRQAEETAWDAESGRYEARIAAVTASDEAAKAAYDRERQAIEDAKDAEADRHATRMAQIEAEAALELLRLGNSEEEVQRILGEQQAAAQRIAQEAAARWSEAQVEINRRAREAREQAEAEAEEARNLERFIGNHPPELTNPGNPGVPVDPGGPPGLPPAPPPIDPILYQGAIAAAGDMADAGALATDAWASFSSETGVLADQMDALADSAAGAEDSLVAGLLDPALDRLVDMVSQADRLRDLMTDIAGTGGLAGAVQAGGNWFVFQGPVTIDADFAEEYGLLNALGNGP